MKLPLRSVLLVTLCSALLGSLAHGQQRAQPRLYRWVDDQGVVHYGDRIPPEYADRDRDLLNTQGVAVGSQEGVVTAEERAEVERLAAIEEAARQARAETARRDQVLLDTYLSVAEIEHLRDRRLELLAAQIKVTEHYLSNLRKRMARLQQEASGYKPYSDNPDAPDVPEALGLELSRTIASISLYEQTLAHSRSEQQQLTTAFERDIERFRELKGG
ncbi:MAG TPA: DUF4124 domain-containing protein [Gammaproteobacteria bacterium]|nr:DUF4124 domain-containing protein [Gammaproteobacteria bacterium]